MKVSKVWLIEKWWPVSESRDCILGVTNTLKSAKRWAQTHEETYISPSVFRHFRGTEESYRLLGGWTPNADNELQRPCSDGSFYQIIEVTAEITTYNE